MRVTAAILGALGLVLILVLVKAAGECGASASCMATAEVNGRTYSGSLARGMQIDEADLVPYATATRVSLGFETVGRQVYRLGDVDPEQLLVIELMPGQEDGAGPVGSYLVLITHVRAFDLACRYFSESDPFRPEACGGASPPSS